MARKLLILASREPIPDRLLAPQRSPSKKPLNPTTIRSKTRTANLQAAVPQLIWDFPFKLTNLRVPRWALRMLAPFFFLKELPHFFKSHQSW